MMCYDMSDSEEKCQYAGKGIKEKGDPNKRFCGETYTKMLQKCPKRCPNGECPEGMLCFEESPCVWEGTGVEVEEKDPSKMFCGNEYSDAALCGTSCESGSNDECPGDQSCFADVECQASVSASTSNNNLLSDLWKEEEEEEESSTTPVTEEEGSSTAMRPVPDDFESAEQGSEQESKPDAESPSSLVEIEAAEEGSVTAIVESKPATSEEIASNPPPAPEASNPPPAPAAAAAPSEPAPEFSGDTSKMYCGNAYADAAKCSSPCPGGQPTECPGDQSCFADVECKSAVSESSNPFEKTTKFCGYSMTNAKSECWQPCPKGDADCCLGLKCFDTSTDTGSGGTCTDSDYRGSEHKYCGTSWCDAAYACRAACPGGTDQECPGSQLCFSDVPCGGSKSPPSLFDGNMNNEATTTGVRVTNLRMALHGLDEFSALHLLSWEQHTADYFEGVYNSLPTTNDSTLDAVTDVEAKFDIDQVNLSATRRLLRNQRNLAETAYLLTYTQTTQYSTERDIELGQVIQHPFSTPTKRDKYVEYLRAVSPGLFRKLTSVSPVYLPLNVATSITVGKDDDGGVSSSDNVLAASKYNSFYCHNSGRPCPTGKCGQDGDLCMFVPDKGQSIPVAPYTGDNGPPQSTPSSYTASILVDLALGGEQPSQSSADNAAPASNRPPTAKPTPLPTKRPSQEPTPERARPSTIDTVATGLEMTLHGILLVRAEQVFEWQYLTSLYWESFFNNESQTSSDYIKNNVNGAETSIEITNVKFEVSPSPRTTVTFKQTTKYDTKDSDLTISAVIMQPFELPQYRDTYVSNLKRTIPASFGELETVSSIEISRSPSSSTLLADAFLETFTCSDEWPVSCAHTGRCENGEDCPAGQGCFTSLPSCTASDEEEQKIQSQQPTNRPVKPSTTQEVLPTVTTSESDSPPCDLCKQGQVKKNAVVNFNGKQIDCVEAYNVMRDNFKASSTTCISAQDSISSNCCNVGQVAETSTATPEKSPGANAGTNDESPTSSQGTQQEGNGNSGNPDWLASWETTTTGTSSGVSSSSTGIISFVIAAVAYLFL